MGQHALQSLQGGLALGRQVRQTLLIGVECGYIPLALLCREMKMEDIVRHLLVYQHQLTSLHKNKPVNHNWHADLSESISIHNKLYQLTAVPVKWTKQHSISLQWLNFNVL